MAAPTAAEIRALSQVDFAEKGYVEDDPDPLTPMVDVAVAYIETVTARRFDLDQPRGYDRLMLLTARMATEQLVEQGQADTVETAGDSDLIASFSAGPYSETRRDQASRGEQRRLNTWPALDRMLWLLLTLAPGEVNDAVSEMLDYWRWMLGLAPNPPAWTVVEVDWHDNRLIGSYASLPVTLSVPD